MTKRKQNGTHLGRLMERTDAILDCTPEQVAAARAYIARQPHADELAAILFGDPL